MLRHVIFKCQCQEKVIVTVTSYTKRTLALIVRSSTWNAWWTPNAHPHKAHHSVDETGLAWEVRREWEAGQGETLKQRTLLCQMVVLEVYSHSLVLSSNEFARWCRYKRVVSSLTFNIKVFSWSAVLSAMTTYNSDASQRTGISWTQSI